MTMESDRTTSEHPLGQRRLDACLDSGDGRLVALVHASGDGDVCAGRFVVLARRASAAQAVTVEHGVDGLSELVSLRNRPASPAKRSRRSTSVSSSWASPEPPRPPFSGSIGPLRSSGPGSGRSGRPPPSAGQPRQLGRPPGCLHRKRRARPSRNRGSRRITNYVDASGTALTLELDRLEASTRQPRLVAALESLRWRVVWLMSPHHKWSDLSTVWFRRSAPTPAGDGRGAGPFRRRQRKLRHRVAKLRTLDVAGVVGELRRVEADPGSPSFRTSAVSATCSASPSPKPALRRCRQGRRRIPRLLHPGRAADASSRRRPPRCAPIAPSGQHRNGGFMTWLLSAPGLALASIGRRTVAGPPPSPSRSGTWPATPTRGQRRVQLDAEPSPSRDRGPRETRVAFGVFTEAGGEPAATGRQGQPRSPTATSMTPS